MVLLAVLVVVVLAILLLLFLFREKAKPKFSLDERERFFVADATGRKERFGSLLDAPSVDLSVVVPAYNEEKRIVKMLEETVSYLQSRQLSWEIIVVDDGSRDRTTTVVNKCGSLFFFFFFV